MVNFFPRETFFPDCFCDPVYRAKSWGGGNILEDEEKQDLWTCFSKPEPAKYSIK